MRGGGAAGGGSGGGAAGAGGYDAGAYDGWVQLFKDFSDSILIDSPIL